jgi:hypothetical protein
MSNAQKFRRRLAQFGAVTLATLAVSPLGASPAQATYGPAQPVSLQLSGQSGSTQTLVGRAVGTIQFDDGNSSYLLSLTLCRQSSYTAPTLTIYVNDVQQSSFSGDDGVRRPDSCGGGHGMSLAINGAYSYPGVVQKLRVKIDGLYFSGSTASDKSASATYDNPFN